MDPEGVFAQFEDGTGVAAWVDHLSRAAPRAVNWLWPGRVPVGKVTLLIGDPGRGKSLLALDMAARVSRGAAWPDAAAGSAPLGRTLILSAEDDTWDTIRPRLDALGGDPARVSAIRAVDRESGHGLEPLSLARDMVVLDAVVRKWSDTRLVILDPVSAYLGGGESNNNADIHHTLAPVQAMAEARGVAVVAITHLTKRANVSVLYRAMGSLAYVAASRAVWAVAPDREAAGRMLFLPVKCNLVGGATGLAYRIVPSPDNPAVPTVAWEPEPVAITAEEAMEAVRQPTPRERAAEWLLKLLSAGPAPATEIELRARAAGLAAHTVRRAKADLEVASFRQGAGWTWRLPEQEAPTLEAAQGAAAAPADGVASEA